MNETDTRAKLIDPAIHAKGWTEDLIPRKETAGAVELIEAKAEHLPPEHGLEQAEVYAASRRVNVPSALDRAPKGEL